MTDIPLRTHRPRPLLRRQRPAVGVLLPQRLRLRRGRLRRPGDQVKHEAGYVLRQGDITFVLDLAAVGPTTPTASGSCTHGDGVHGHRPRGRRRAARLRRRRRAAAPSASRRRRRSRTSTASTSTPRIRAYGDTTHTLRQPRPLPRRLRARLQAARPGPLQPDAPSTRSACAAIDHIVGNVEEGKMDEWVEFYQQGARLLAARPASTTRTSAPSTRP